MATQHRAIADTLDSIEGSVLPGLAKLIDDALGAASGTRGRASVAQSAAELRGIAEQLNGLTRLLSAVTESQVREAGERHNSATLR